MRQAPPFASTTTAVQLVGNGFGRNWVCLAPTAEPRLERRCLLLRHERSTRRLCSDGSHMLGFCLGPPSPPLNLAHRIPINSASILELLPLHSCHRLIRNGCCLVALEAEIAKGQIGRKVPPPETSLAKIALCMGAKHPQRAKHPQCQRQDRCRPAACALLSTLDTRSGWRCE